MMIITKKEPFTKEEIVLLQESFEMYVKTVIDINKKICSAGCHLHADSELILRRRGSQQKDIWGGGINIETKDIDFNAMINIRPSQNNLGTEILDGTNREKYERLTKYFFKNLYE